MDMNQAWNSFADGVTKAARTVSNVAVDVYGQGKKYVKKANLKRRLHDKLADLGELVQAAHEGRALDETRKQALHAEIAELKEAIRAANASDEPAVAVMTCEKCGAPQPSNATYCSSCGAKL